MHEVRSRALLLHHIRYILQFLPSVWSRKGEQLNRIVLVYRLRAWNVLDLLRLGFMHSVRSGKGGRIHRCGLGDILRELRAWEILHRRLVVPEL